jgi:hypothetical protein
MNTIDIEGMSVEERIQAMEAIWASLLKIDSDMESPGWHLDVLTERRRHIDGASAEFVSLAELKAARR